MKTKEFKVGDKVFDIRYGWGKIINSTIYDELYPLQVLYEYDKTPISYTIDGKDLVANINPILSHTEYSTQSEYPKVMEVSDCGKEWLKRVVFMEKGGRFIAWSNAETFEEAKYEIATYDWKCAREVQELREISLQEIADKFGIPVEEVRIKK